MAHKAPIIDVRMFKSFNFAVASLMMFFLGVLLFSSLVMMPQFLQTLMGYTAECGAGAFGRRRDHLLEMPIVGQLRRNFRRNISWLPAGGAGVRDVHFHAGWTC